MDRRFATLCIIRRKNGQDSANHQSAGGTIEMLKSVDTVVYVPGRKTLAVKISGWTAPQAKLLTRSHLERIARAGCYPSMSSVVE